VAEIVACLHQRESVKSPISPNGQFEFQELLPDCYYVRIVVGQPAKIVLQQRIQAGPDHALVQFVLRPEAPAQPAAGYVSLRELAAPPPAKAVKALQRAQKYVRDGKLKQAAEQYREATGIDADYAEAHQELGSLYLQMGRLEPARVELLTARRLGLESPDVLGSLALVLVELGQPKESESAAREALAKDPTNAVANYALGFSLLYRSTDFPLILEHLARAAEQVPSARLLAAKVRVKTGDVKGAIQDLKEYLRVCPEDKRAAAEATLRELQAQTVAARR
jgi:tetratricopeptide (TPR) repeat protein